VQLAYFRYPGRALQIGEAPSPAMLGYISQQLGFSADLFTGTPHGKHTARAPPGTLHELPDETVQPPESASDVQAASQVATGTDRGEVIVQTMIEALRASSISFACAGHS